MQRLDQTIRAAVTAKPRIATLLPGQRVSDSGDALVEHRSTRARLLPDHLATAFKAFARAVLREPDGSAATTSSAGYSWFIRMLRLDGMVLNRSPSATAASVFHSATRSGVPLQCSKDAVVRVVIPMTVANAVFAVPGAFPALPSSARFVVPNAGADPAMSSIFGYISNFFELGGVVFAALWPIAVYPVNHRRLSAQDRARAETAGLGRACYVPIAQPIVVPVRALRDRVCVCPDEQRPPPAANRVPSPNEIVWIVSLVPIPQHGELDTAGAGDPNMEPLDERGAGTTGRSGGHGRGNRGEEESDDGGNGDVMIETID
ncbi:hypothetical protein H9P43_002881 [Blastocladiella emersonii ATCC 22665]|nr:hypothetical protein H9P43_002881 [Blastocladiella emersonii ATCC 22665]